MLLGDLITAMSCRSARAAWEVGVAGPQVLTSRRVDPRAGAMEGSGMAQTHYLSDDRVHFTWDTSHEPLLTVESGDTVVVTTRDVSDDQIGPHSDSSAIAGLDWDRVYPLAGPIAVAGATPGDTLAVEILDIHTRGWGWTAILPGLGLLPEDFPDAYLRIFDLTAGDVAWMREDIWIPLEPFFGTMGVCPAGASAQPVMPPGTFGGNMDTRQLVRGSTLYLPVQVDGALFSCGDAHGAQGDGEVCVTGLEAPMYAALRFTLESGRTLPAPQYRTPAPLTRRVDHAPFYGTTGVGGDLYIAAQDAIRAMVDHLATTTGLTPEDAYLLASLVVDLKISEIVDAGQYIVSALLPEAVLSPPPL
jgi:acetamidase/formamidase